MLRLRLCSSYRVLARFPHGPNIHNANIFRLCSFRAVGKSYRKVLQKNHLPYRFIRTPCSKNCPVVSCTFDTTRVLLLSEFWFQPVLLGKKQKASNCFAHKPSLCYVKYVHVTSSSSSAVSTSNPTRTCSYVPTTTSMITDTRWGCRDYRRDRRETTRARRPGGKEYCMFLSWSVACPSRWQIDCWDFVWEIKYWAEEIVCCGFSLLTEPPTFERNLTSDQRRVHSRNQSVWRKNVVWTWREWRSFPATRVGLFGF